MFLEGKGWVAQEFYNEYLELKEEILQLTAFLKYKKDSVIKEKLDEKVERMRFVLASLKENNVPLENLILLSLNVDLD